MGKEQVSFRIETGIIKDLKYLALEQDRNLTDLFLEAIRGLLAKYKKDKKR
jgi:hypothetical protein